MVFAILLPGIWNTIHFTSQDIKILPSIFLFTFRDIGYLGKLIFGIFASLKGIIACLL